MECSATLMVLLIIRTIQPNNNQLKIGMESIYRGPKKNKIILGERNMSGMIAIPIQKEIFKDPFMYFSSCAISLNLETSGNNTDCKE